MKKLTTEEFIKKAKKVHGDKYDYSETYYVNNSTKICIVCSEHGKFYQTPHDHLSGSGCKKCYNEKRGDSLRKSKEEFIEKAKKVHDDKYDYSKVEYVNDSTKVCIICPEHGEFWQRPNHHLQGNGCSICGIEKNKLSKIKPYEDFVKNAIKKHNNKYEYDRSTYIDRHKKMRILCPLHGEFWQRPNNHLQGQGCPFCNESVLEKEVENILTENGLFFLKKCNSSKLKWLGKQHLDFYLPDYSIAIECQGIQHFEPRDIFGGKNSFIETIERDNRKKIKCSENNVNIIYYSSDYIRRKYDKNILTKNNLLKKIKNG